ncbi:MAG TPA: hypothetical protein VF170_17080, partial [Planctomycetaceae bacterium]
MAERSPRNWLTLVLLGAAAAVPWHRLPAQQESSPPGTPSAETAGDGRGPETSESQYDDEFRDPVDASAPSDPKAAKRLQQAESLIAQQRWERAQEVLLFTLDRAEGAMVRRRDGRLVSVADEANRLLGTLPRDALELYRRQYGPAADKLLAEGVTSGRRELVEQVATQFRHTRAGGEAVRRLAAIHFDRGEFGLAARRYRQLAAADFDPAARIRAAYAFAATGDVQEAERLLASLTDADRAAMPAGWDADRLVAAAGRFGESRLVDDWLLPQGDATGAALVRAGEPVLLRRWSRPLTHRSEIQEQIDRTTQDLRDEGRATVPASVPLAVGDRVAARTLRGVAVYSSSDGRLLWETVDENSPERLLAAGDQSIDAETRQVIRFRFQFGADPSAGASDQKPLANLLYRDGVYGFLSSDGERLFAVEDHSPLLRPEAVFLDGPAGGAVRRSAASNRLVAYDLDTGRPAWPAFGGL